MTFDASISNGRAGLDQVSIYHSGGAVASITNSRLRSKPAKEPCYSKRDDLPYAVENEYMRHPSLKYREEVAEEDSPGRQGEHTVVSLRVVTEVSNRLASTQEQPCF